MRSALFLLFFGALASAVGCSSSDDGNPGTDGGDGDGDAAPTTLTFETQVTDLLAGTAVFDVTVSEVGTQTTTTSAPNGRAVLEVRNQDTEVSHELTGFLSNTTAVSAEALRRHNAANEPLLSHISTAADLDTLYSGIGLVVDDQTSQVLVYVRAADFSAATGVTVTVGGAGQSFVRGGGGDFEAGDTIGADATVLVPNVVGAQTNVTISASCAGPTTLSLAPGAIATAFYVCDPSS